MIAVPALAAADAASDMRAARASVAQMEKASNQVQNLLQNAKAQNDAIKVSCLSDKSTEIAGYVKGATEALGRADASALQAIESDAGTVERLRTEASACVGVADAEDAEQNAEESADAADALTGSTNASVGGSTLPSVRVPPAASPVQ